MIHLTALLLLLAMNNAFSEYKLDNPITHSPNYLITQLPSNQTDLSSYLPTKDKIGNWLPTGSPEQAIGEDLFVLINGGAEIYHEYGFKQVIMQSYENEHEKAINLEIYEMTNSASAFGIYSFKTSHRGKELPLGDKARLEDYYLNFWKGNFLITITGFDSEPETIDGLITIAKAVNSKIKSTGELPLLAQLLPAENLNKSSIKYLKGNLALFNSYDFGTGGIFGLKEGVIGDYDKYKIFIFKYDNKNESEKWFKNATNHFKSNAKFAFDDLPARPDEFVLTKDADSIFMKLYQDYIIIAVGKFSTESNDAIEKAVAKINSTF